MPARWVDDHIERLGGWRVAPRLLVAQLAALHEDVPPLALVPRRQARHLNSQLDFLGGSVDIVIHPDDAAASGVADGDAVIVRSEPGELTGVAKVDPSIRVGAVSVPHGHQRANVNRLTCDDEIDAPTGMARYSGIPISLQPLNLDRAVPEQRLRGSTPG